MCPRCTSSQTWACCFIEFPAVHGFAEVDAAVADSEDVARKVFG